MARAPEPHIAELVPGRIFAVTGYVPTSLSLTWMLPGLSGVLGVSCYVVKDGEDALIVDSGLALHRDAITRGLESVLKGTKRRSFVMTRREPDSIINLPWLIQRFGLAPVYCGGALNPLDFFERIDERNTEAHINAVAKSNLSWLRPGMSLAVGSLTVDVLRTRLCVLPKTHVFERATGTLFGSDSWGSLAQASEGPIEVVTQPDPRLGAPELARYLRYKFDWLAGIDTTSVADDLAAIAGTCWVERICPGYGAVIEGADLSRHVIAETAEAIRLLADEPFSDRLRGLDVEALRRAAAA